MTRQINDVLCNNGQDYDILEVDRGGGRFQDIYEPPATLNVCSMSTACYKGYNARFEVSTNDDRLALKALRVRTSGNVYPNIEGVAPMGQGISFNDGPTNMLWADYVGMDVPMSHFSGRVLLGADFLPEVNSWDATSYARVVEIHVADGRVTNAIERSEEVAGRRRQSKESGDHHPYSWKHELYERELELQRRNGNQEDDEEDL